MKTNRSKASIEALALLLGLWLTQTGCILFLSPNALYKAARDGNEQRVERELANKSDPNKTAYLSRSTPLMEASQGGHSGVVRLLLNAGAEVDHQSKFGSSALILSAANGYDEIVAILLENGANSNLRKRNGKTALMMASGEGGGIASTTTADGRIFSTPIPSKGNVAVAKVLLSHGADPNLADEDTLTALHYAAFWGQ